jgi:hypothetical protein
MVLLLLQAAWDVLLQLSPWMLFGMLIAGVLHVFLPSGFIQKNLQGVPGVWRAIAVGIPLPLCSCSVIPTGLGLKKDGADDGASIAFMISTPQTGVDSIMVCASFLGWPFALFKVLSAGLTGWIGGMIVHLFGGPRRALLEEDRPDHHGEDAMGKMRSLLFHSTDLLRSIWKWLLFGVLISAVITVFIPPSLLSEMGANHGLYSALVILLISVPLYVCATSSVPIAAALVVGGMPLGAALVFLMAGPATNVATIGAVYRGFGSRILGIYLATVVVGSLVLGLGFDFLLESTGMGVEQMHHSEGLIPLLSTVILLGFFAWFVWEEIQKRVLIYSGSWEGEEAGISVPVSGMSCGGCTNRLSTAINNMEDVEKSLVTLEPGHLKVWGKVDLKSVLATIEGAGFKSETEP